MQLIGANITQACDKFKTASHVVGKLSAMLGAVETDSEGSPRGFFSKQKAQSKILSEEDLANMTLEERYEHGRTHTDPRAI